MPARKPVRPAPGVHTTFTPEELARITTYGAFVDAFERGVAIVPLMSTPYMQQQSAERRAILDRVKPHFKARQAGIPFYQERLNDEPLWDAIISSWWGVALEVAERLRDGLLPWPEAK